MNKPFENLTVLDLSRYLLGAYPSLYLADFGARVIKVEDTKVGDYCRQEEPQIDGESYYHYALNRNKESVSFNLKDPEVLDAFYKLVISADVIIENYRPGVAKRLGIDYETLSAINPRIIYCSLSAYGQNDPRSLSALHDVNIVTQTGYYDLTQGALALLSPADFAAAMVAIQSILTALIQRGMTNRGAHLDVAMYDSLVWWNAMLDSRWFFFGKDFPSSKREYPSIGYNIYRTKDDQLVAFGFYETNFWDDFCHEIGCEELCGMLKNTKEENPEGYAKIQEVAASKTHDEWEEWNSAGKHPITPIFSKTDAVEYALENSPGLLEYVDYPRIGTVLQTNTPHVIGEVRADLSEAREPELLGESSAKVLRELGLSDAKIADLEEKGSIVVG